MKFTRFITMLLRVRASEPEATTIHFLIDGDDTQLVVRTAEFDVAGNAWIVKLTKQRPVIDRI